MQAGAFLPSELVMHIHSYLAPDDRARASRVCRQWAYCASEEVYWKGAFARDVAHVDAAALTPAPPASVASWRAAYAVHGQSLKANADMWVRRYACIALDTPGGFRLMARDLGNAVHWGAEYPLEYAGIGITAMGFGIRYVGLSQLMPGLSLGTAALIATGVCVTSMATFRPQLPLDLAAASVLLAITAASLLVSAPLAGARTVLKTPVYAAASFARAQQRPARKRAEQAYLLAQLRRRDLANEINALTWAARRPAKSISPDKT